jgi:hypothetical protein
MKQVELTLYEIFGYLIPGAVFTAGLSLVFWAIFYPTDRVDIDLKTPEIWGSFLVLSYIAGHVAQGVTNLLVAYYPSVENALFSDGSDFPKTLVEACRAKVKELTGADAASMSGGWIYRVCDSALVKSGKIGDRDLFVYREGFYRGTFLGMISLVVGFLSMIARIWDSKTQIGNMDLTIGRLLFFAVIACLSAIMLWRRYWRFAAYRATNALIGALIVELKADKQRGNSDGVEDSR